MHRVKPVLVVFALFYAALLLLFVQAVGTGHRSALWYVWFVLGVLCLATIALELALFATWGWMKWRGFSAYAGVPRRLNSEDIAQLEREKPGIALLMPAHSEASTESDRAALVERICSTLEKTPPYTRFFLLADSPESEAENERAVIEAVRDRVRANGHPEQADRVALEEYRDKPADWRHKCGSILSWIRRHGHAYEYMFILDADSSLMEEDPDRPETCDVVERMALAMMRDKNLAMVQAAMHIKTYESAWGWMQAVNSKVGTAYYVPLFSYIYGRNTPCYGHNCLFRVRAFAEHARNTLHYTSHDHMDAADLAAGGMGCVMTDAALTYEEPEDNVLLWLKRECRWSRGNGQWFVYLARKRGLPLPAVVFIVIGIAQYLWAVFTGVFFFTAVALVPGQYEMITHASTNTGKVLIAIVMGALIIPKLLASPSIKAFLGATVLAFVLGPAVMIWQGISFLLGAFGNAWIPRGARSSTYDWRQMLAIARTLAPVSVVGMLLYRTVQEAPMSSWAGVFMHVMVWGMIFCPLTAVLVSWPLERLRALAEVPADQPARHAEAVG